LCREACKEGAVCAASSRDRCRCSERACEGIAKEVQSSIKRACGGTDPTSPALRQSRFGRVRESLVPPLALDGLFGAATPSGVLPRSSLLSVHHQLFDSGLILAGGRHERRLPCGILSYLPAAFACGWRLLNCSRGADLCSPSPCPVSDSSCFTATLKDAVSASVRIVPVAHADVQCLPGSAVADRKQFVLETTRRARHQFGTQPQVKRGNWR
jgi:hypothetical protein